MVITEAELREAWRDGRGSLPEIPADARLTPAARDFLVARGICPGGDGAFSATYRDSADSAAGRVKGDALAGPRGFEPPPSSGSGAGSRLELRAEPGKRLILTATDVDGLVSSPPECVVVHPEVTVTDLARERLRNAGVRIVPFMEKRPEPLEPISHNETAQPPSAADAALAREARAKAETSRGAPARAGDSGPEGRDEELYRKVKAAVMAKLAGQVDEALVDAVLRRVLASLR